MQVHRGTLDPETFATLLTNREYPHPPPSKRAPTASSVSQSKTQTATCCSLVGRL